LETVANALCMPAPAQSAVACGAARRQHSSGDRMPMHVKPSMRPSGQDAEWTRPPHSMALLLAARHLLLNCRFGLLRSARRRYHRTV
jgi:hypothetical protein